MKTKVVLGLAVCCLLVCLGGFIMSRMSQAQILAQPMVVPVTLVDDYMRQHGIMSTSYFCEGAGGTWHSI